MSTSKHDKTEGPSPTGDDLADNPGIGQSAGLFQTGADPNEIAGENTVEGDTANDPASGSDVGRTNA